MSARDFIFRTDAERGQGWSDDAQLLTKMFERYAEEQNSALRARIAAVETILLDLQWNGGTIGSQTCVWCDTPFPNHSVDCKLAAALRDEEG